MIEDFHKQAGAHSLYTLPAQVSVPGEISPIIAMEGERGSVRFLVQR